MTSLGKFVALIASIALFVGPVTAMPLHCILMAHSGSENPHQCHMSEVNSSANQITAPLSNYSCCHVSAAEPGSVTLPQLPAGMGTAAYLAINAFMFDLPVAPVCSKASDGIVQSPGGSPQAVLCIFLI